MIDKGTYLTGPRKKMAERMIPSADETGLEMTSDSAAVMYSLIGSCKT